MGLVWHNSCALLFAVLLFAALFLGVKPSQQRRHALIESKSIVGKFALIAAPSYAVRTTAVKVHSRFCVSSRDKCNAC